MSAQKAILDAIVAAAKLAVPALVSPASRTSEAPQALPSLPPEAFPHLQVVLADSYVAELLDHGQERRTYPVGALLAHRRSGDAAVDVRELVAADLEAIATGLAQDRTLGGACDQVLVAGARIRSDPSEAFVYAELLIEARRVV